MYVRIARFDGGSMDWDELAQRVGALMRGEGSEETPMDALRGEVKRMMMLVDRDNNRGANFILTETEEQIRRVDDAMNRMTPQHQRGERTGVEIYEVLVDEQPGG